MNLASLSRFKTHSVFLEGQPRPIGRSVGEGKQKSQDVLDGVPLSLRCLPFVPNVLASELELSHVAVQRI